MQRVSGKCWHHGYELFWRDVYTRAWGCDSRGVESTGPRMLKRVIQVYQVAPKSLVSLELKGLGGSNLTTTH